MRLEDQPKTTKKQNHFFINDFRFSNNIYASIYAEHFIPSVGFRINHKSIRRIVQSIVIKNRSIQSA